MPTNSTPTTQVFDLFPTPLMRVEGLLSASEVAALHAHCLAHAATPNQRSPQLAHVAMRDPASEPLLASVAQRVQPHVVAFGNLLFGQTLEWQIKEMWGNVLLGGGAQSVHNHANCFASGIVYLTDAHASAQTVFIRSLGGRDFVFNNSNPASTMGPYNAERWIAPPPRAGDMVLFPSYLLHEVPPYAGELRVSLAFNAIPTRLDSWGYAVSLSA